MSVLLWLFRIINQLRKMNRPKPINEAAAEQQLREEYERVMGEAPDEMAGMICKISAERAMRQDWEWTANEGNKNWGAQLNWK